MNENEEHEAMRAYYQNVLSKYNFSPETKQFLEEVIGFDNTSAGYIQKHSEAEYVKAYNRFENELLNAGRL